MPNRKGITQASSAQQKKPRLPHEHDESSDSQQATKAQTAVGRQAYRDLENGLVDTDRGPVMDKLRGKLGRSGAA